MQVDMLDQMSNLSNLDNQRLSVSGRSFDSELRGNSRTDYSKTSGEFNIQTLNSDDISATTKRTKAYKLKQRLSQRHLEKGNTTACQKFYLKLQRMSIYSIYGGIFHNQKRKHVSWVSLFCSILLYILIFLYCLYLGFELNTFDSIDINTESVSNILKEDL